MANFTYPNRADVFNLNPRLAEALDKIAEAINNVSGQVAANPSGSQSAPPSISSLKVSAADGIFDVAITDNNPVSRGINYFLEYSTSATFSQPHVVDLGASRNYRANWGSQTLYFRAYSQYPTSSPSAKVYYGSAGSPTAVSGGGSSAGPTPLPSTGSGTAPSNGLTGGAGFGYDQYRAGVLVPPYKPQ